MCIYVYISVCIYVHIYISVSIKRFRIWNWLMWLWGWPVPRPVRVSWHETVELMIYFQSKFKGLRARRISGVFYVRRLAGSRPRKSWYFSSQLQAGKKLMSYSKSSQARKNSPFLVGQSVFLLCSGLQLIEWGPPTLGRAICFTNLKVNLTEKHPHRKHPE